jgi:hypothetical protein
MEQQNLKIESSDFHIDELDLTNELINQPSLVFAYTTAMSRARIKFEEVKRHAEVVKARVSLEIRKNASSATKKPTEAQIEAMTILNPEVEEAEKAIAIAKYNLDMYGAAVDSLESKKRALTSIVQLHTTNYFGSPNIKNDDFDTRAISFGKPINLRHNTQNKDKSTGLDSIGLKSKKFKKPGVSLEPDTDDFDPERDTPF